MNRASFYHGYLCVGFGMCLLGAHVAHAEIPTAEPQQNRTENAEGEQQTANSSSTPRKFVEAQMSETLLRAYQREFAVLETEKRMLQQRLNEMRRNDEIRVQRAKEEYSRYETELMAVSLLADQKERELGRREIDGEQSEQVGDVVATIEAQADEVLKQSIVDSKANESDLQPTEVAVGSAKDADVPTRLGNAFQAAIAKLAQGSDIKQSPASFFDAAGKKVDGTVLRMGQVAAFGVTDSGVQALAPAGAGALKIWPQSRMQQIDAHALSLTALPLQLFLADNWTQAIEVRKEKTPLQIVQDGGTIAWVIVGLGVFALLLSLVRTANLFWVGRRVEAQGKAVATAIKEKAFPLAEQICDNNFAISDLLRAVLASREMSRDAQHDLMDEQILGIFARVDRFGQMILVAAAVAPLLGLLGTVTGMISTFDAITEFGTGDPRVLAGGISEALITTELGLIVAIPSLLLGNLLSGYAERLKGLFEAKGLQAANLCRENDEPSTPTLVKNEPVWTRVS